MAVIYKIEHLDETCYTCTWMECENVASHIVRSVDMVSGLMGRGWLCDKHTDDFNAHAREHSKEIFR